jgi:CHAD domain-containing protein
VSFSIPGFKSFRQRLDAFERELPRLEEGRVEARHRVRVASRRLRELVPLLGLDRPLARKLSRRLRIVTRQLGVVRELDVLMLLTEELRLSSRYRSTVLEQVGLAVAHEREAAHERLEIKLSTAKLKRLARKLERVADLLESVDSKPGRQGVNRPKRAWQWALEARIAQRAERLRSAIDTAGALYAPEHLHRVRIALKKLRYASELLNENRRERSLPDLRPLKRVQDLLGRLHDMEVLLARSRAAQATLSPPDLTEWRESARFVRAVEDECRRLHAGYMRDRSELIAIADRVGAITRFAAAASHSAVG